MDTPVVFLTEDTFPAHSRRVILRFIHSQPDHEVWEATVPPLVAMRVAREGAGMPPHAR